MEVRRHILAGGGAVLLLLLSSCTKIANYAEKRADRAAYGNIHGAQLAGLGQFDPFSIQHENPDMLAQLLELDRRQEEAQVLSLSETLAIALANSPSYQTRKENLFIEALNLTEVQKDFSWNFGASADASTSYTKNKDGTTETFGDNGVDSTVRAGVTRTLATGAKMSLGFTQNYINLLTSPDSSSANNALSFNIVQPLLNGFGPLVTMEPLRQAERDMIYAVREFKRYQQDFVIEITAEYYSTLRARDALTNARKNYEASVVNREQTESYAKAGRLADFEAAQARQNELNSADRFSLAVSSYETSLDDLRYTLGLPVDLNIEPDPNELTLLGKKGLVEIDIKLPEAIEDALTGRLDLLNKREQVEDRQRRLEIAKRNFMPTLDAGYNVTKQFDSSDGSDISQDLSVNLVLPLDWTEKRNNYRKAQINLDQEIRSLNTSEDNITRTVRDYWRKLERNRSVYNNRLLSVTLSERRVENTELLLKQGKAQTRDLLDAQDDLLSSKNEATLALVDYTINRLRFWNAIERFEIDPKGMWYEQSETEESVETAQQ